MITPVAGSIFVPGQKTLISFHASSTVGQMRTIQFSPDSINWSNVGTVTDAGDTTYSWTIPNTEATKGYVSVTDSAGVTAKAGPFIIYPVPANNLIVDYWAFNTLSGAYYTPNIPNLTADFTAPGTTPGYIQYVNFAKTPGWSYIDNVAGDAVYTHLGAPAGNALRVRNPTDSMQLVFWIPTTGFSGITLSYALQASSTTGPQVQHFAYNTGNGIWTAAGITVNGADSVKDSLDVTQSQYQQSGAPGAPYGFVTIGFTSAVQAAISNNPNFQFRIIFGDTATGGTSGNNRFDNFTVTAQATDGVNEPLQAKQQLVLSPNPAGDYVSFQNPYSSPVTVSVLDILGHELLHSEGIPSSNIELNTSSLPSGSYFMHLQNVSTGASQMAKFVKQ
jgi:Secretion system C-terminal sorting domain